MIIMHIIILIIIVATLLMLAIMFAIKPDYYHLGSPFFGVLCLIFSIWMILAINSDWRIEYEQELDVKDLVINNKTIQIINYMNNNNLITRNVNLYFGCTFPPNSKIKRIVYAYGPYYGVTFVGTSIYLNERLVCDLFDK